MSRFIGIVLNATETLSSKPRIYIDSVNGVLVTLGKAHVQSSYIQSSLVFDRTLHLYMYTYLLSLLRLVPFLEISCSLCCHIGKVTNLN